MFCWVPSHTDNKGTKRQTDTAARSGLDLPHAKVGVPYTDFKHCISQYILSTWQGDLNGEVANKRHSVKAVLLQIANFSFALGCR